MFRLFWDFLFKLFVPFFWIIRKFGWGAKPNGTNYWNQSVYCGYFRIHFPFSHTHLDHNRTWYFDFVLFWVRWVNLTLIHAPMGFMNSITKTYFIDRPPYLSRNNNNNRHHSFTLRRYEVNRLGLYVEFQAIQG